MNEEEKQAYNYLEKYIEWETFGERNLEEDIKTILNLIKKTKKKIQKDYIPMSRLDLMRKKLIEKGRNSLDLEEKKKIQYTLGILYQLNFYIKGE